MSAFGSGTNENQFLIDGTNFTCPCNGIARAEPGIDFIQEVQVQSVGASAEFGNVQGAVINVVTRQGSERFLYDASYYGQTAGLTSQPVLLALDAVQPAKGQSGYERAGIATSRRISAVLLFAIGCGSSRDTSICATTTVSRAPTQLSRGPTSRTRSSRSSRGNWLPGWQLVQSVHDEFWVNPEQPTFVKPFEATLRPARIGAGHDLRPSDAHVVGQYRVGCARRTVRLLQRGRPEHRQSDDAEPVRPRDGCHQRRSAAVRRADAHSHDRQGDHQPLPAWAVGADHEWKMGGQVEKGEGHGTSLIPTGVRYEDKSGVPFQAISSAPSLSGGLFITAAAFASDALTVGDRLTINAGVRFDHSRAISQDLRAIDPRDAKPTRSSAVWERCTPGTCCRHAWVPR